MTDVKKSIQLLFDRPGELLFMPKGEDNSVFEVTPEFLTNRYSDLGIDLSNRFGEDASNKIPLRAVQMPDLTVPAMLSRDANFSLFIPKHQEYARELIGIFMSVPENQLDEFLAICAICKDRVNAKLFNYCLSVALLHRPDTKDIPLANFVETFPAEFVNTTAFQEAREISKVVPAPLRTPIIIPKDFTATDLETEHRLAYFREDIGVNLHHWHWHLVYPFDARDNMRQLVDKNRRGELFYYMHQQIIARYNNERLCNSLPRVKRFNNFREPIVEGYYPKLDSLTSRRAWVPRQAGEAWQDLDREIDGIKVNVSDIENWRDRIEDAISSGRVQKADGTTQKLNIDLLGNMIESSILSPNRAFYGQLHNYGHLFTAYIHDPNHKYLETNGVMADEGITMRDPFFYRWHAQIDSFFQKFKGSPFVQPYSQAMLMNPNINVTSVEVTDDLGANTLHTYWMQSDVDLSRGLDFAERGGSVYVRFTHLNYRPFTYNIAVNNTGPAKRGTVRIFIAPKADERGLPWSLTEQRLLMVELDRFVTELNSGNTTITRRSDESSVTIPFERTFRSIPAGQNSSDFNFCGCGWPQHMLIPKGTASGAAYELFVMVSNYDHDKVDQSVEGVSCADASSFCGIRDRLYPDKRAMGYPFDRPPDTNYSTLADFRQPNMAVQDIAIQFQDVTEPNPRNAMP